MLTGGTERAVAYSFSEALPDAAAPPRSGPLPEGGAYVDGVFRDELTLDREEAELAELTAHMDAGVHRQLTLIRVMDVSERWAKQGAVSCAHWLSWRVGLDLGAAREHLRVSRALATLPRIDEALRLGKLSYSKARAMTRVATPDNEAKLLDMAFATTAAQLERICRGVRRVKSADGSTKTPSTAGFGFAIGVSPPFGSKPSSYRTRPSG